MFLKCKDNILLLYKTTIQSSCFNFGRMLSCQIPNYKCTFQATVICNNGPFSGGNLRGSLHFHCGDKLIVMFFVSCLILQGSANTPLFKEITAPYFPIYSHIQRKRWKMYCHVPFQRYPLTPPGMVTND